MVQPVLEIQRARRFTGQEQYQKDYLSDDRIRRHPGTPRSLSLFRVNKILPQAYIGLSSMKQISDMDGSFSLTHFYHIILDTLSDSTDSWVIETMEWWQK